ncbi:polysaccharide biosynthesis C-terminal domain-containing protein [Hymenobacter sp. 5516J-16]|uniref:lipopolysaccharide biosynthesis protein n=1 Tax=Hymenobacter sp. 5516J-16 TaxID=2932253 RepID=UPI001FD2210B|nr:polysaccharide biosynthesis C-terminal domain-containing protein [Hymenobacter sp. 5516J-16]UOQ78658.1 polysaccharide biosynthesis C-terminal domain-containing protein [Hymenobacter sp. 5516J-16]
MLRRIVHNFATRLGTAFLSFGVVWLTARYLGAAGRGAISLFVTDCAALLLFIGLLGGSSLIYLAPRRNLWHLLLPAYGWAVVVCIVGTATVAGLRHPGPAYLWHLAGLSTLQAFFSINTSLVLGRRREGTYNLLTLIQVGLLAGSLLVAFQTGGPGRSVQAYYWSSYVAFGVPLLLSFIPLLRQPDRRRRWGRRLRATTRELARHSRGAHLSNILAFANYRLSYYFVAHYVDLPSVGILSVGVALVEAIWLIPRSAALVQYVDLVHSSASSGPLPTGALRVARLAVLATAAAVGLLIALPVAVLTTVFGAEFGAARPVMVLLAPGAVIMAVQMVVSSYFAGRARYRVNNLASVVGLGVTLLACPLLIPSYGIRGAALAATLSYGASTAFLLLHFWRDTGAVPTAFLPGAADVRYCWQLLRAQIEAK